MGIFPLTVLRDSHSPWDPMESLGVAGKGVQHTQRMPPLWLPLSRCFIVIDLCHLHKDLPGYILSFPFYPQRKPRLSGARIYTQLSPTPKLCSLDLCRLGEGEEGGEEGGRPCL